MKKISFGGRRRPTSSLSWKCVCFLTAVCCSVALTVGVLVHLMVKRETVEQARSQALGRLDTVRAAYVSGRTSAEQSLDPAGLPPQLHEMVEHGQRGTVLGEFKGQPAMWAAMPTDSGWTLAVHTGFSHQQQTLDALDSAIVLSAITAITATLVIGCVAARRVRRRLNHAAAVARRISGGDLEARVDEYVAGGRPPPHDEVGDVAAALNMMAAAAQHRLVTEQRFTADVAHELRTPLTGLSLSADLLPPGRPKELVQDRIGALRTLTEDLLEISRLDSATEMAEREEQSVAAIARVAIEHTGHATELNVVNDATVLTDRRRLDRILANLINNAHFHGQAPVVVRVDGPCIHVHDHGDGYPDYLIQQGPQRFRTEPGAASGKGHGLGLTIVTGHARLIAAEVTFTNPPGGGATATVSLPSGA
ncbi:MULTISPECIES: sensor histidine kinase [unclassified Streptomyces]|uniref:sensor histidine kinase n=1 Tax=unclassified Streptomyces TaxID=2593676 RepID=UPI00381022B3